ncbi:transglycosylase domain-containing protein [Megasphaera vaginalis (ex Srinivasan et al. 2021)]|uniref:Transglycosylase n=1 Tax=Megasphaera vaginalis (ex Srinivasan et al. 2021) TaxID=1111454 RepID=U7UEM2_9FIRM|nr:biosynthetic peptidoglycan transglycosylase [Megasphaera vaginalis (ex Srinivasan et al. 2021)]ERT57800.1 transglycosylase [Megasphaera vaginalis (ex Srinivasan et al. 2021)]
MKLKFTILFALVFAMTFAWITFTDNHHTTSGTTVSKQTEKNAGDSLYIYLHFRETMEAKIKAGKTKTSLREIPKSLQQAVLATEDRRFYEHGAVDPIGILRALATNLQSGKTVEGGSSISQQVVKNMLLSQEQTVTRKAQELILAILLERNYTKDQILEMYFNTAYFGANATGIAEACHTYYGKAPSDLSLGQASLLAGLLQAPTYYNPLVNYNAAKDRQRIVLAGMTEEGYITKKEAVAAYAETLHLQKNTK